MLDDDIKREIHEYIDAGIDKHNEANQRQFKALRAGQLKLEVDMESLAEGQKGLSKEIQSVRAASETAHTAILAHLGRIDSRLDRIDNRLDNLEQNQR